MEQLEAVTLAEAARRLGLTVEATRARYKRGKLDGYPKDGRIYVYVSRPLNDAYTEPKQEPEQPEQKDNSALDALMGQLQEKDRQIAGLQELLHEAHRNTSDAIQVQADLQRKLGEQDEEIRDLRVQLTAPRDSATTDSDQGQPGPAPIEEQETTVLPRYEVQKRPWWKWWG